MMSSGTLNELLFTGMSVKVWKKVSLQKPEEAAASAAAASAAAARRASARADRGASLVRSPPPAHPQPAASLAASDAAAPLAS